MSEPQARSTAVEESRDTEDVYDTSSLHSVDSAETLLEFPQYDESFAGEDTLEVNDIAVVETPEVNDAASTHSIHMVETTNAPPRLHQIPSDPWSVCNTFDTKSPFSDSDEEEERIQKAQTEGFRVPGIPSDQSTEVEGKGLPLSEANLKALDEEIRPTYLWPAHWPVDRATRYVRLFTGEWGDHFSDFPDYIDDPVGLDNKPEFLHEDIEEPYNRLPKVQRLTKEIFRRRRDILDFSLWALEQIWEMYLDIIEAIAYFMDGDMKGIASHPKHIQCWYCVARDLEYQVHTKDHFNAATEFVLKAMEYLWEELKRVVAISEVKAVEVRLTKKSPQRKAEEKRTLDELLVLLGKYMNWLPQRVNQKCMEHNKMIEECEIQVLSERDRVWYKDIGYPRLPGTPYYDWFDIPDDDDTDAKTLVDEITPEPGSEEALIKACRDNIYEAELGAIKILSDKFNSLFEDFMDVCNDAFWSAGRQMGQCLAGHRDMARCFNDAVRIECMPKYLYPEKHGDVIRVLLHALYDLAIDLEDFKFVFLWWENNRLESVGLPETGMTATAAGMLKSWEKHMNGYAEFDVKLHAKVREKMFLTAELMRLEEGEEEGERIRVNAEAHILLGLVDEVKMQKFKDPEARGFKKSE